MMSFQEAMTRRTELEDALKPLSAALRRFPQSLNGLTPDEVKFSPAYKEAKAAFDAAFRALREHNAFINRQFRHEIREHYRNKRQSEVKQ